MEIKTGAFTSEQLTIWQAETNQKATKIAARMAPKCNMEAHTGMLCALESIRGRWLSQWSSDYEY